jgi:hypothetical protein
MTSLELEPATFRLVAQHPNLLRYRKPQTNKGTVEIILI